MEALKEKILKEGFAQGSSIVKVDGFINHRIDTKFMEEMGYEFRRRFADVEPTLLLTIETSGIAVAMGAAKAFGYLPMVFGKKTNPEKESGQASGLADDCYAATCISFTKGTTSIIKVKKDYIRPEDKVLILDDFLAHGEAASALCEICAQAGAEVLGIGAAIEKQFQGGSAVLRGRGIRVESLAVISAINEGEIVFG